MNLKSLRTKAGYSQKKLAEILGVTQQAFSLYELGEREADYATLNKLADLFDCTTDYLLGRTDEPNLVHYDTGVDYEGHRVYIDIVKDALDQGLSKEDIEEFIEMGLAWRDAREAREAREAKENKKKKPK